MEISQITVVVVVVFVVVGIILIASFNSLVGRKNNIDFAFAGIDTMLKKRYDLIPNLVNTIKKYTAHEKNTLMEITELRAKAISGVGVDERVDIDNKLSKLVTKVMSVSENYPELKSNENFIHLQKSLNEVEEQIAASRRAYNAAVTEYNNSVSMFPSNIIAGILQYRIMKQFEASTKERANVDVGQLFDL